MAKYVLQALPAKAVNRSSNKLNDAQVLAEIEVGAYAMKPLSISAKPNLIYQLVDPLTGAVVKGQKIYSKGRNLQVEVDGTTVVELTDFFVSETKATEPTPTQQEAVSTTATTESLSNLQDASAFDCEYAVIHSQTTKGTASEARSMLWQPGQSATDCLNLAALPETTEVGALAAVLGVSGPVSAVTAGVVTAAAVSGGGSGGSTGSPAVIGGTTTGALTETDVAQSTVGTLTSTDSDGTNNLFVAQTGVAGGNSYGKFSITTGGVWTYMMNTAHDEFVAGMTYTDTATVSAADGTTQVLTVMLTGTNDAPTLSTFSASIGSVNQDTSTTITFDSLKSKGDEKDVDSEVIAFVVKALSSGTLLIGTSADTATVWVAGTNDTIDANHFAFWQPDSGVHGTFNAFTVVAKDASLESSTPVQVVMTVTDNVAPTATLDSSGSFNNGSSVSVKSSETGVAYLVKNTDTVTNVNDFSSIDGSHWNSQAITTADTDVSLSLTGLIDGTYTLYTADASGNLSAATGQVTLDSTSPVASFASVSDTGTHSINDSINVQSTEVGTAYLVQDGHTVSSLSDILSLSDQYYNSASISSASANTSLSLSGLDSGIYHLYTVDATGNLSAQSSASVVIPAVTITSAFVDATVTNFDVRSDIVFTSSETVTAAAGKYIHIINDDNTTAKDGFNTESTAHSFDILVTDSQVTISGNTITLNLSDDLDLSNNYHITIDDGAFIGDVSGISSTAISSATAMDFSTVTPGTGGTTSETYVDGTLVSYLDISSVAALSKKMDSTGALVDSYQWFDLQTSNTNSDSDTQFKYIDMTKGAYALVAKDYNSEAGSAAAGTDGIKTRNFYIAAENFSINDLLYIDNQQNNSNIMDNAYINSFTPTDDYNRFEFSSVAGNGSNKGYIALKVLSLSDENIGDIGVASHYFVSNYYLNATLALSANSIISA